MEEQNIKELQTRYGKMEFFANDVGALSRSLIAYGEWAENELQFLHSFISEGGSVVDVGAYIGTHTLAFSQFLGEQGCVFSFEAQPRTYDLLCRNVAKNKLKNVRVYNAAVLDHSDKIAITSIDTSKEGSFGSAALDRRHLNGPPLVDIDAGEYIAEITASTIDDLNLDECSLIKIDAEGTEDLVLQGAVSTIQRCEPIIYAECNSIEGGIRSRDILLSHEYNIFFHVVYAFNKNNYNSVDENIFGDACETALVAIKAKNCHIMETYKCLPHELLLKIEDADDIALGMLNKPQYIPEVLEISAAAMTGGRKWLTSISDLRNDFERLKIEQALVRDVFQKNESELKQLSAALETAREEAKLIAHEKQQANLLAESRKKEMCSAIQEKKDALAIAETYRIESERSCRGKDDAVAIAKACMEQARIARMEADHATAQLQEQKHKNSEIEVQAAMQLKKYTEIQAMQEAIYSSHSWRISAPLRWVGILFRRIFIRK